MTGKVSPNSSERCEEPNRADEKLRESEERYRILVDNANEAIIVMQAGMMKFANRKAEELSGYPVLELMTKPFNDYVHPDDRAMVMERFMKRMKGEPVPDRYRFRIVHRTGITKWLEVNAIKFDWEGKPATLSLATDVTEQWQAEQELRNSEEKFRMLAEQSITGTCLIQDGKFVYVNPRLAEMLGYGPGEMLGLSVTDLVAVQDRDLVVENIRKRMSGEVTYVHYTFHALKKDGSEVLMEVHGNAMQYLGRRAIMATLLDITEQKRTEVRLQNMQKLDSLGILAGGIAHDFNNLMGGIFGYIDLARSVSKEAQAIEYLNETLNVMSRARALTQQLLTFAKGGSPIRKPTPLIPFIQQTARFALSGSNISCRFNIAENLRPCNIDKNQIGQAIDNIIINAQQAMPNGGNIEVAAKNISLGEKEHPTLAQGIYVKVSVRDFGVGIPTDVIPHIFDPFYTTKTKGHGLGLATSYSIITRHEGCIDVESAPGAGSVFHVYLPASTESVAANAPVTIEHKGSGTIIVMDDEEMMRGAVRKMLESLGYAVVCKNDGREAIDFYTNETKAKRRFAALLLDLTVPGGMGGKEAVTEIRKIDKEIPVFAASGYADDPVIISPAEYGFTASISKPFTIADLSEMLNGHLRIEANG